MPRRLVFVDDDLSMREPIEPSHSYLVVGAAISIVMAAQQHLPTSAAPQKA